jgi:hypothetical protein
MVPTFDDKPVIFYVDNEVQSVSDLDNYWYEEIAYIKAYPSLWLDDTRFMRWKTGYTGFTLSGGGSGLKAPNQSDPPVICIYTRKGPDIRTGWAGLNKISIKGYDRILPFKNDKVTLLWNPWAVGNEYRIRFTNNETTRRFRVKVEGISYTGKVIHYETIIE